MEYKIEKKCAPEWGEVDVLAETFENGLPASTEEGKWEQKLASREEKLKYIQEGERYWYGKESFGSEKRKTPA